MRNICTHPGCLFCMVYSFFCIALHTTWKRCHVDCKHKIFVNFGFVLITYILFTFHFSLLYNLSSFHHCLHFVWHSKEYKLLTKTLLLPSFSQKYSIEWSISNLSSVKTGPQNWCAPGTSLWYSSKPSCLFKFISYLFIFIFLPRFFIGVTCKFIFQNNFSL